MNSILSKKINGWLVTVFIGLLLTGVGLLPISINATQQCPDNALVMPDGSSCIIGAPVGPPLWLIGVSISVVAGLGFVITQSSKNK